MKTDRVETFHISIWPDDYGSETGSGDEGSSGEGTPPASTPTKDGGTGCLFAALPQVITKAELGEPGLPTAAPNLEPLPARVRKLVALRRKQMS